MPANKVDVSVPPEKGEAFEKRLKQLVDGGLNSEHALQIASHEMKVGVSSKKVETPINQGMTPLEALRQVSKTAQAIPNATATQPASVSEGMTPLEALKAVTPAVPTVEGPGMTPLEAFREARKLPPTVDMQGEQQPQGGELPWWKDLALAGSAFGAASAAAGAVLGAPLIPAAIAGAGLYMGAKHLMGVKPTSLLKELGVVDTQNEDALAFAEEVGLQTVLPVVGAALKPVIKPLLRGGAAGVKGVLSGVDWVNKQAFTPMQKIAGPPVEQLWENYIVPSMRGVSGPTIGGAAVGAATGAISDEEGSVLQGVLIGAGVGAGVSAFAKYGLKKDLVELLQPAVERLEKAKPNVARTFRRTSAMKALASEAGVKLGQEVRDLLPSESYEVMKGLRGTPVGELTSGRAKNVLNSFDKRLAESKLDVRYENAFRDEVSKLLTKPVESVETALGPGAVSGILQSLEQGLVGHKPHHIRKGLTELIKNPNTPREMQEFAKDIYSLSAKTSSEVADAARAASTDYLTTRLAGHRGLVSATPKAGYVQSEWGAFKGLHIDRDVELELQALTKIPMISRGWYQKWMLSPWKSAKVIVRPAAHVRNLISNTILNDWGGLPFYRVDIYMDALKELRSNGAAWKELRRYTGLGGNFSQNEIYQVGAGLKYDAKWFDKLYNVYDRAITPAREMFAAEESLFKLAKYMHNKSLGMKGADAALDAMKWTFNYSEVSEGVAQLRRTMMPFATWYSKSVPLMVETAVKHPVRFWKWMEFGRQIQNFGMQSVGMSEDEWQSTQKILPSHIQNGMYLMMPWRDDKERLNLLNMTYIMPGIGDMNEFYQRSVPEIAIQNPFITAAGTVLSKRKFSGAPLYYDWEEASTKWAKTSAYLWEQFMPAVVPGPGLVLNPMLGTNIPTGGTDWNAMWRSIYDESGTAPTPSEAVAGFFGFKLTPVDLVTHTNRTRAVERIHESEMATQMQRELRSATSDRQVSQIMDRYQRIREKRVAP